MRREEKDGENNAEGDDNDEGSRMTRGAEG